MLGCFFGFHAFSVIVVLLKNVHHSLPRIGMIGCLLNSGAEDEDVMVLAATTFAAFATLPCTLGADTPPVHGQTNVPRKTPSLQVC